MTYIITLLQSVVEALNFVVKEAALSFSDGHSSSFLDQESEGGSFIEGSKFAFVFGWAAVAENSMSLDENLVNIHDKASSVPEGQSSGNPSNNSISIFHVVAGWA